MILAPPYLGLGYACSLPIAFTGILAMTIRLDSCKKVVYTSLYTEKKTSTLFLKIKLRRIEPQD